jgi:hypothetical protein
MEMPLYPRNLTPAPTPAESPRNLELENSTLRMRVAVLTEALRAAEEELTAHRFGECEHAAGGVVRMKGAQA